MRITNAMITNSYLKNLNSNLESVDKYQNQVSTGKQITLLSDDPVGALTSLQARSRINRTQQYKENVLTADEWMKQTETSLKEINEILKTAYERSMQASTDILGDAERTAIAEEILQLRDQVFTAANTKVSNKFIFGGYNTLKAPFQIGASGELLYNGNDISVITPALQNEQKQHIGFEIGFDMSIDVSTNGVELLGSGENNVYGLLDGLAKALQSGDTKAISAFIPKLQGAQEDSLALMAKSGGITNRLELIKNRYEDDKINYSGLQSRIEDVDVADAITQYKTASAVYLFALKIGSNIIQPTLVDYLR